MLAAHPEIHWDREVFEPWRRARLDVPEDTGPADLIRMRYEATPLRYGFETKYLQAHHVGAMGLTPASYITLLRELGFTKFVALHRRNYLRRIVSGAVARETGEWHRTDAPATRASSIHLDPERVPFGGHLPLLEVMETLENGEALLREHLPEGTSLWLWYEDDIARDPLVAYRKICDLYGVEPVHAAPDLHPSNPFPLSDMLENHDEIASTLAGTRFEWMLTD